MPSSKEYCDYVLDQLSLVEEIDNKEFLQQLVNNMLPELPEKKK